MHCLTLLRRFLPLSSAACLGLLAVACSPPEEQIIEAQIEPIVEEIFEEVHVAGQDLAQEPSKRSAQVAEAPVAVETPGELQAEVEIDSGFDPGPLTRNEEVVVGEPARASSSWQPEGLDVGFDLSGLRAPERAASGPRPQTPRNEPHPGIHPGKDLGVLRVVEGSEERLVGKLLEGVVWTEVFVLENQGEGPLALERVHNSCACTVAGVMRLGPEGERTPYEYGEPIEVGERIDVTLVVDTNTRRGMLASTATLSTTSVEPLVVVRVTAEVHPFLVTEPTGYLMLGSLGVNERREETIRVASHDGQPFRLEVPRAMLPRFLSLDLEPQEPGEDGRASVWLARMVLGPDMNEGLNQRWSLRFLTDVPMDGERAPGSEPRRHAVDLHIMADVTGLVRSAPQFFTFGLLRPGQSLTRVARIESLDPDFHLAETFEVSFESTDPRVLELAERHLTFHFIEHEPGRSVDVHATVADLPTDFDGLFSGNVHFHVNHPTRERVTIAFHGMVRGGR